MTLLAEPTTRTRRERLRGPAVAGVAVAGATLALRLRDPHVQGAWGLCPLHAMTGIYCPGCGGLRAVNDLTHGELLAAAQSNLLFVALLPVLVIGFGWWVATAWTGRREVPAWLASPRLLTAAVVATGVFMLVRNLPGFAWLQPA